MAAKNNKYGFNSNEINNKMSKLQTVKNEIFEEIAFLIW
jgi:hypothetical protein